MDAVRAFGYHTIFWARVVMRAIWCTITLFVTLFAYFGLILPALPLKYAW